MSSFPTRQIEGALLAKGFEKDPGDHIRFWLVIDGKKRAIHTKISHGLSEYGDDLLAKMAKQTKLRRNELNDFIRCPLSGEKYVALLRQRGLLS